MYCCNSYVRMCSSVLPVRACLDPCKRVMRTWWVQFLVPRWHCKARIGVEEVVR
jgi:hypothetical protein